MDIFITSERIRTYNFPSHWRLRVKVIRFYDNLSGIFTTTVRFALQFEVFFYYTI